MIGLAQKLPRDTTDPMTGAKVAHRTIHHSGELAPFQDPCCGAQVQPVCRIRRNAIGDAS